MVRIGQSSCVWHAVGKETASVVDVRLVIEVYGGGVRAAHDSRVLANRGSPKFSVAKPVRTSECNPITGRRGVPPDLARRVRRQLLHCCLINTLCYETYPDSHTEEFSYPAPYPESTPDTRNHRWRRVLNKEYHA